MRESEKSENFRVPLAIDPSGVPVAPTHANKRCGVHVSGMRCARHPQRRDGEGAEFLISESDVFSRDGGARPREAPHHNRLRRWLAGSGRSSFHARVARVPFRPREGQPQLPPEAAARSCWHCWTGRQAASPAALVPTQARLFPRRRACVELHPLANGRDEAYEQAHRKH